MSERSRSRSGRRALRGSSDPPSCQFRQPVLRRSTGRHSKRAEHQAMGTGRGETAHGFLAARTRIEIRSRENSAGPKGESDSNLPGHGRQERRIFSPARRAELSLTGGLSVAAVAPVQETSRFLFPALARPTEFGIRDPAVHPDSSSCLHVCRGRAADPRCHGSKAAENQRWPTLAPQTIVEPSARSVVLAPRE